MSLYRRQAVREKARELVERCGSRDPLRLAEELGITVREVPFKQQKGVYILVEGLPFIFLMESLEEPVKSLVLLHEIGHAVLHREEASCFTEISLFDKGKNQLEYEANLFAAEIQLPDDEVLEGIRQGLDAQQLAALLHTDVNLLAIKIDALKDEGYVLNPLPRENCFLK